MTAWGTNEIRDRKPTPLDEVRGGLVLFEQLVVGCAAPLRCASSIAR